MAQKLISKKTYYTTEDFVRDTERNIQREEIRALCEPKKAAEIRKGIAARQGLLDAVTKRIGKNRGFETSEVSGTFTSM